MIILIGVVVVVVVRSGKIKVITIRSISNDTKRSLGKPPGDDTAVKGSVSAEDSLSGRSIRKSILLTTSQNRLLDHPNEGGPYVFFLPRFLLFPFF